MAKVSAHYVCQSCGHGSVQWLGRCPACSSWNTFVEETPVQEDAPRRGSISEERVKKLTEGRSPKRAENKPRRIDELDAGKETRWSTGIAELDRVLGGGMVEGSFVLLAGDPGIGKSTLLLQSLERMAGARKVLYVTGEESTEQVKLRAQRLAVAGRELYLASETHWEKVLDMIEETSVVLVEHVRRKVHVR